MAKKEKIKLDPERFNHVVDADDCEALILSQRTEVCRRLKNLRQQEELKKNANKDFNDLISDLEDELEESAGTLDLLTDRYNQLLAKNTRP